MLKWGGYLKLNLAANLVRHVAEADILLKAKNLQEHGTAQFGDRLATPMLAEFPQFAVAVVGGVDHFVAQVERFFTPRAMPTPWLYRPRDRGSVAVVCLDAQSPTLGDFQKRQGLDPACYLGIIGRQGFAFGLVEAKHRRPLEPEEMGCFLAGVLVHDLS